MCYDVITTLVVLDFSELYQMSCILSEAGLASDAAFTIKEHFSTVPGLKSLSEVGIEQCYLGVACSEMLVYCFTDILCSSPSRYRLCIRFAFGKRPV